MARIELTQGVLALVDDIDYEYLSKNKWCATKHGRHTKYWLAMGWVPQLKKMVLMHRMVMGVLGDASARVDHINHHPFEDKVIDNRRHNLRFATNQQNQANNRKRPNQTSAFKGVSWYRFYGKWRSVIMYNQRNIHIGYFEDEKAAAMAYNAKARELFGEFALLNQV